MKKVDKFFRTCVLPKDRKELEENLLKFKDYRQGLIKDDFERYMTMWDFYFVDVDLVSLIQLINSRRTIYKNSLNFRFRLTMVLFLVQTINWVRYGQTFATFRLRNSMFASTKSRIQLHQKIAPWLILCAYWSWYPRTKYRSLQRSIRFWFTAWYNQLDLMCLFYIDIIPMFNITFFN